MPSFAKLARDVPFSMRPTLIQLPQSVPPVHHISGTLILVYTFFLPEPSNTSQCIFYLNFQS